MENDLHRKKRNDEKVGRGTHVCGSGCVKIGGNFIGSLGFGFDSGTGALALSDGFGALD